MVGNLERGLNPEDFRFFKMIVDQEERVRKTSNGGIATDPALAREVALVEKAIDLFYALCVNRAASGDEATILQLGIRITNTALAALRLTLTGYYQQAFGLIRDIMETGFLVHYFALSPDKIAEWRTSTKKQRANNFSPVKIRLALERAENSNDSARQKVYSDASELAAHATAAGFGFFQPEGDPVAGPFYEETRLKLCVRELVSRLGPVSILLAVHFGPKLSPDMHHRVMRFQEDLLHGAAKNGFLGSGG